MEKLNEDFLEFARLLNEERVDYLVVRGYAVGIHGFPRYTGDIEFFVAIHPDNANRLCRGFARFGFATLEVES